MERDQDKIVISELAQRMALVRFYFGVDCENLPTEQWFKLWLQLEFCLEFEGKLVSKTPIKG